MSGIPKKTEELQSFLATAGSLSGSQTNSWLLTLFQGLTGKIRPADLVRQFIRNRFVFPAAVDPIKFKELELACLRLARDHHFQPVLLSPLAPLGTCSAAARVHQNKVVSALRGTEVVSDATNILAIKIAAESRNASSQQLIRYAATHRHVRGQYFTNPAFSAHFGVFCLVSGGMDTGNFAFELGQLQEHLRVHFTLLAGKFAEEDLFLKIYLKKEHAVLRQLLANSLEKESYPYQITEDYQQEGYYQHFQFKIFLKHNGRELDLADGGLVDWTQKMIPNQKHRLFISGCGLELVEKLMEGKL
jgi:hypothetical protein